MTKHGVVVTDNGVYEFWWFGNRLSLEDFNKQIWRTSTRLKGEIDSFAEGMDLRAAIDGGEKALAKVEAIEEILKLPLCGPCRRMIG